MLKRQTKTNANGIGSNSEKDYLQLKQKLDQLFIPSHLHFSHQSLDLVKELVKRIPTQKHPHNQLHTQFIQNKQSNQQLPTNSKHILNPKPSNFQITPQFTHLSYESLIQKLSSLQNENNQLHKQLMKHKQQLLLTKCSKNHPINYANHSNTAILLSKRLDEKYNQVLEQLTHLKYKYNQLMDIFHESAPKSTNKVYLKRLIKHKRYSIPKWLHHHTNGQMSSHDTNQETFGKRSKQNPAYNPYSSTPLSFQKQNMTLKFQITRLSDQITFLNQSITLRDQEIERLSKKLSESINKISSKSHYDFQFNRKNQQIKLLEDRLDDFISINNQNKGIDRKCTEQTNGIDKTSHIRVKRNDVKGLCKKVSPSGVTLKGPNEYDQQQRQIQRVKSLSFFPQPSIKSLTNKQQKAQMMQSPRDTKKNLQSKQDKQTNTKTLQSECQKKRRVVIDIHPKQNLPNNNQEQQNSNQQRFKIQELSSSVKDYKKEIIETKKIICQLQKKYNLLYQEHETLLAEIKELSILNEQLRHDVSLRQKYDKVKNLEKGQNMAKINLVQSKADQIDGANSNLKPTTAEIIKSSVKSPPIKQSFSIQSFTTTKTSLIHPKPLIRDLKQEIKSPNAKIRLVTQYDQSSSGYETRRTQYSGYTSPSSLSKKQSLKSLAISSKPTTIQPTTNNSDNDQTQRKTIIQQCGIYKNKNKFDQTQNDQMTLNMKAENLYLKDENALLNEKVENQKRQKSGLKKKLQVLQRQIKQYQDKKKIFVQSSTKKALSPSSSLKLSFYHDKQQEKRHQITNNYIQSQRILVKQKQIYEREFSDWSIRLEKVTKQHKQLTGINRKLRMELSDMETKLEQCLQQTEEYKHRVIISENQLMRLKEKDENQQLQISKQQQLIIALQSSITKFQSQLANHKSQQSKNTTCLQDLITQISVQQQENINLRSTLSKAQTQIDHLNSELLLKQKQLDILNQSRNLQLKSNTSEDSIQMTSLKQQLQILTTKCQQLMQQNQLLLKNSFESQNQTQQLKAELQLKIQKIVELQRQLLILQNQLQRLQSGILEGFLKDTIHHQTILNVNKYSLSSQSYQYGQSSSSQQHNLSNQSVQLQENPSQHHD